jgi:hypothetical protein
LDVRHTAIVALGEPVIPIQAQYAHGRKILSDELDTSIGAAVIDDKDVVLAAIAFDGIQNRWN